MKEQKIFQVNYLLSMSRLPDHFYASLHHLKGRDADYKNPGVSLRSFIVGTCLRREVIRLEGEMLNTAHECERFSTDPKVISEINDSLTTAATWLIDRIDEITEPQVRQKFAHHRANLSEGVQAVKFSFDSFIMTQDPSKDLVDIMSLTGINLKDAFIDLQDLIKDVAAEIDEVPGPSEYA